MNKSVLQIKEDLAIATTERARTRVSDILGLPLIQDLPRPGQARTWELREWLEFLSPYDFYEGPQTAHNYVVMHITLPSLRIGMSTSPGDTRSRANFAQSVRYIFRAQYENLAVFIQMLLTETPSLFPAESLDEDRVYATLREYTFANFGSARNSKASNEKLIRYLYGQSTDTWSDGVRRETLTALTKAAKLMKASERDALSRALMVGVELYQTETEEDKADAAQKIESIHSRVKSTAGVTAALGAKILAGLRDVIDIEEAIKEDEAEARRAVREARDEQAKPAGGSLPSALTQKEYASACAAIRGKFNALAGPLFAALNDAVACSKALSEYGASFPTPSYPSDQITELSRQNTVLGSQLEAAKQATADATAETSRFTAELVMLKETLKVATELVDEAAVHSDWKTKYEHLVDSVSTYLSPEGFLALATGVALARTQLAAASVHIAESNKPKGPHVP